jgi:uncharacterized Zn finger protein (UPF0148 family)
MTTINTKFICTTSKGHLVKKEVILDYRDGRIFFVKSPYELKDEIKCMQGSQWHGYQDVPLRQWSVKDSPRNRLQILWLQGENPFEWFERTVQKFLPEGYARTSITGETRKAWDVQHRMINNGLTFHYQIIAGCMGAGKTFSAFEIMERSGLPNWMWVGPKTTLLEIILQTEYWQLKVPNIEFLTYDKLTSLVKSGAYNLPQGIVFDEASKLKSADSSRTAAAQEVADKIRAVYGMDGYVLTMSGTPSPKTPVDIWALAEITYPGFLKEGSAKALEQRIAVLKPSDKASGSSGGHYNERVGWLDRDGLCKKCGQTKEGCAEAQAMDPDSIHAYTPSINEVAHINTRLEGLMTTVFKQECPPLPGKRYIEITLDASPKLMKVAAAIQRTATSTMQAMNQLRQLSDGFLYRDKKDGTVVCPTCSGTGEIDEWYNSEEPDRPYGSIELMDPEKTKNFVKRKTTCTRCMGEKEIDKIVRETVACPCPKIEIVEDLLEKAAEVNGRILLFGGFQGSVDRMVDTCLAAGWEVFRCDGRGSVILGTDGKQIPGVEPLRYWKDMANKKVAFVANPESGGFGLTLVEAYIVCFYSNSFKPEFRVQAEERADRPGQVNQVLVYDLLHLPSDKRTLTIIRENRRLENMVLGDILGNCFSPTTSESTL